MSAAHPPELKKFMDKKVLVKLPTGMTVEGVLRGFDPFMNMVLDESIGTNKAGEKESIGMIVVRGNSCVMMEAKDRIFWILSMYVRMTHFEKILRKIQEKWSQKKIILLHPQFLKLSNVKKYVELFKTDKNQMYWL